MSDPCPSVRFAAPGSGAVAMFPEGEYTADCGRSAGPDGGDSIYALLQSSQDNATAAAAAATAPAEPAPKAGKAGGAGGKVTAAKPRSSKYRGVTKHRRSGRWEAHIWVKELGRQVYLGGYEEEIQAAEVCPYF